MILNLNRLHISKEWTLFLDRDGVINSRIPFGYVKSIEEFEFLSGVLDAFPIFSKSFEKIIVVSNQQGVGKGIMSQQQLDNVHCWMKQEIEKKGGRIDEIFVCTQLSSEPNNFRKPSPIMAFQAKDKFPEIVFSKSIMVGDTDSDILFGKNAGMFTILIGDEDTKHEPDFHFNTLIDFALSLK